MAVSTTKQTSESPPEPTKVVEEQHSAISVTDRAKISLFLRSDQEIQDYLLKTHGLQAKKDKDGAWGVWKQGETEKRRLDPNSGAFSSDLIGDMADWSREIVETGIEAGVYAGLGAITGGASLFATTVVRGSIGGIVAGAEDYALQKIGQTLGVRESVDSSTLIDSAGMGALLPGALNALTKPAGKIAAKLAGTSLGKGLSEASFIAGNGMRQTLLKTGLETEAVEQVVTHAAALTGKATLGAAIGGGSNTVVQAVAIASGKQEEFKWSDLGENILKGAAMSGADHLLSATHKAGSAPARQSIDAKHAATASGAGAVAAVGGDIRLRARPIEGIRPEDQTTYTFLSGDQVTLPKTFFDFPVGIRSGQNIRDAMDKRHRITVLELGGTIASVPSPDGKIPALGFRDIVDRALGPEKSTLPELYVAPRGSRKFHFGAGQDSSAFDYPSAMRMVDRLYYHSRVGTGTVVTCGTDRMADLAMVADSMMTFPPVPIVFTGAQRTVDMPDNDVGKNLRDAAFAAKRLPPGVYIVFNGRVIGAQDAIKHSTVSLDAFQSHGHSDFGSVDAAKGKLDYNDPRDREMIDWLRKHGRDANYIDYEHDPNVEMVELSFGLSPERLRRRLADEQLHGAVIKVPGMGGLPPEHTAVIKEFVEKKPIVVSSRCPLGQTRLDEYANSHDALSIPVISSDNMSADAALIRLQWLLGGKMPPNLIREAFHSPYAYRGALSDRSTLFGGNLGGSGLQPWNTNPFRNKLLHYGYIAPDDVLSRTFD